jgi:hypothetical protein
MIRKLALTAALIVTTAPAFACECAPDNGQRAAAMLSDHSISIADVTVKGYNNANGWAALTINTVRAGWLTADRVRARFNNNNCPVAMSLAPMTVAIKAEDDGTYSLLGQCDQQAARQALTLPQAQPKPEGQQVEPNYPNPGAM